MWTEFRTVTKTATVSLHGNTYQVDELLTGRKVELVFDPFDLTGIEVRYGGRGLRQRGRVHDRPPRPPQSPPRATRPARAAAQQGSTTCT